MLADRFISIVKPQGIIFLLVAFVVAQITIPLFANAEQGSILPWRVFCRPPFLPAQCSITHLCIMLADRYISIVKPQGIIFLLVAFVVAQITILLFANEEQGSILPWRVFCRPPFLPAQCSITHLCIMLADRYISIVKPQGIIFLLVAFVVAQITILLFANEEQGSIFSLVFNSFPMTLLIALLTRVLMWRGTYPVNSVRV